jgi:hypothetical protein
MQFTYRPVNAFNISVEPIFSHNYKELQYVTTAPTSGEDRYVMGRIEQTTARISLRMTYMVTPNLSVQYYGQPFGTSGKYTNFKYISNGNAPGYFDRFVSLPNEWLTYSDQQYTVDENHGGLMRYSFQNPDFNFGQFRSNMVIRWEYIPGSTLFLVWTREKNGAFYDQQGSLFEKYKFDFTQKGHNIYLLKFTYRFRR